MPSFYVKAAFSLLLISLKSLAANAAVTCNSTHNPCEDLLREGSECVDGFCTNPFEGGCLKSFLKDEKYAEKYASDSIEGILRRRILSPERKRVCNSEDQESSPFCKPNDYDGFSEIRIYSQNWESALVTTWILQIILSEILNVPTTTETGMVDKNNNIYNRENRMDYGSGNDFSFFQNAYDAPGGDCTIYKAGNDKLARRLGNADDYIPCAHYVPEVWGENSELRDAKIGGIVERPALTELTGSEGWWHITKFSIERDPSLSIYTGYQDLKNRQKLAETFKRPTTWGKYCTLVSTNNCSIPDGVANRAPLEDGSEDGRYFIEGSYTGHFRATDKNNCTKNENCTGHFMDSPCGWESYFKQQSHHLGIALESNGNDISGGYSFSEMVEIWKAADATKSNVVGLCRTPDPTLSSFIGTESEFIKVTLPLPTKACEKAREDVLKRCDDAATEFDLYGDKEGACDEFPAGVKKVVVGNLQENIKQNKNWKTAMSPAHGLITDFHLNSFQLDIIFQAWLSRGIDKDNFDLRFVTCEWMANNLEYIANFIPPSHPREFVETPFHISPITISALVMSTLAITVTVVTAFLLSGTPTCQSISAMRLSVRKNSQIEFVNMLLTGLFFVTLGALLLAMAPSNGACIASVWLLNVGYTLVLVPTLVRVSAIIKVIQAGKKFRRVTVDKKKLVMTSIGISAIAALFCLLWTVLDPMKAQEEASIDVETRNDLGETVTSVSYAPHCESVSDAWYWVSFVWQCLLLVSGSALAFQLRSAPKIVNDSRELALMIYSSFMFLILRIVLQVFSSSLTETSLTKSTLQKAQSIFWSIDSIVNVCIYFSKFFRKDETDKQQNRPGNVGYNNDQAEPGLHPNPPPPVERGEEKVEESE